MGPGVSAFPSANSARTLSGIKCSGTGDLGSHMLSASAGTTTISVDANGSSLNRDSSSHTTYFVYVCTYFQELVQFLQSWQRACRSMHGPLRLTISVHQAFESMQQDIFGQLFRGEHQRQLPMSNASGVQNLAQCFGRRSTILSAKSLVGQSPIACLARPSRAPNSLRSFCALDNCALLCTSASN